MVYNCTTILPFLHGQIHAEADNVLLQKTICPLHTSLISFRILENFEHFSSCKELPCAAIYLTLATPASYLAT